MQDFIIVVEQHMSRLSTEISPEDFALVEAAVKDAKVSLNLLLSQCLLSINVH
jgi:hypothetical protein